MKRFTVFSLLLLLVCLPVMAQKRWSLQECVDYAWANNLTIKQRNLQTLNAQVTLNQSKWQQAPTVNANSNLGWQTGRSVDRFTNQFVQQTYNFNSWGLNATVPIFSGFQIRNSITQNKQLVEATKFDTEQARQDAALNTVLAYLNILNNEELVEVAKLQIATTQQQLDRTKLLVDAGSLPPLNLFDLQSQLANDNLTLVTNQNNVNIAKINLTQSMNLQPTDDFAVVKIEVPDPADDPYPQTAAQVYEVASKVQPAIRAATTRIESSRTAVRVARGGMLPTFAAFGGLSSNYVSTAPAQLFEGNGTTSTREIPIGYYKDAAGKEQPVFTQQTFANGTSKDNTYFRQLNFNLSTNYGFSLQIPLLNARQARTAVSRSVIQQQQNEIALDQAQLTLRQNIEQAYVSMTAAAQRYRASREAVIAQQQSFNATKVRVDAGLLNSVDLTVSQTRLGTAKANLVQAKYDYLFRTKILDFYQNKPLTF
jgi:outer membrane protein